ncbi:hypothetical protein C2G38_2078165 [Gigaspora rosea]|uniref:Uncharacterized protein n=1 Tax=Gigaspora rosea TaxID=44941 RepID=A0A397VI67_9GLOM|nr:hypothetical protein C2G38_2078165 [Gigaspora rosea]
MGEFDSFIIVMVRVTYGHQKNSYTVTSNNILSFNLGDVKNINRNNSKFDASLYSRFTFIDCSLF